uniref:VWFA domain-containing protein n=1 Tax=Mastacembelus armatus TaxID=205130 RepID=A0A3Q3LMT7_9TELE
MLTRSNLKKLPFPPDFFTNCVDIVFLLDGSDDTRRGFPAMKDFVQRVIEKLSVDENKDRVSVVQYSREPQTHFSLKTYTEKQDVLNAVQELNHQGGKPLHTGAALDYVRNNAFADSSGKGVPQYLYVFSGGRSGDDVRGPAQSLKENGIKTFSIGTNTADTLEMQTISFTPAHYFHLTNFSNLQSIHPSVENKLHFNILEIADIVFLLDGSDDMRASESKILDFVREFVKRIEIGPSRIQVALIQYSTEQTTEFILNTYSLKDDVLSHLNNIKLKGGFTVNTGVALDYVKNNVFTALSGSRAKQGVPQILILLSGRKSEDDVIGPVGRLRDAGIVLFSVGMNDADMSEIQFMSSDPNYAYSVPDFVNLPRIQKNLMRQLTQIRVEEEYKAGKNV